MTTRMTTRINKLESIFSAVAFAEAGEHKTALEIAGGSNLAARRPARLRSWFGRLERAFAAVAFAEGGMREEALAVAGITSPRTNPLRPSLQEFVHRVGLSGVPVFYGVAPI